jgi:hypothetical protein
MLLRDPVIAVVLDARQVLLAVLADRLRPGMTIPLAVSLRDQILAEYGQETLPRRRKTTDTLVSGAKPDHA